MIVARWFPYLSVVATASWRQRSLLGHLSWLATTLAIATLIAGPCSAILGDSHAEGGHADTDTFRRLFLLMFSHVCQAIFLVLALIAIYVACREEWRAGLLPLFSRTNLPAWQAVVGLLVGPCIVHLTLSAICTGAILVFYLVHGDDWWSDWVIPIQTAVWMAFWAIACVIVHRCDDLASFASFRRKPAFDTLGELKGEGIVYDWLTKWAFVLSGGAILLSLMFNFWTSIQTATVWWGMGTVLGYCAVWHLCAAAWDIGARPIGGMRLVRLLAIPASAFAASCAYWALTSVGATSSGAVSLALSCSSGLSVVASAEAVRMAHRYPRRSKSFYESLVYVLVLNAVTILGCGVYVISNEQGELWPVTTMSVLGAMTILARLLCIMSVFQLLQGRVNGIGAAIIGGTFELWPDMFGFPHTAIHSGIGILSAAHSAWAANIGLAHDESGYMQFKASILGIELVVIATGIALPIGTYLLSSRRVALHPD
jgi:hypothetical protein